MATASPAVASTAEDEAQQDAGSKVESSWVVKFDRIYTRFTYTPPNCRHDPSKPPRFSLALNILFSFASAFTVADLYYTHPILNILAKYFGVSYEESASVPTLAQAGYAIGLFFLCPLGDLLRRRRLVLWLVWLTATLWYGLLHTWSSFLTRGHRLTVSYILSALSTDAFDQDHTLPDQVLRDISSPYVRRLHHNRHATADAAARG